MTLTKKQAEQAGYTRAMGEAKIFVENWAHRNLSAPIEHDALIQALSSLTLTDNNKEV